MTQDSDRHLAGPTAAVARVDFGACVLLLDDDTLLAAIVRGRVMGPRKALGNTVVVGDRVRYEPAQHAGRDEVAGRSVVGEVLPRRNVFSRRAPGRRAAEQAVAANLDQVLVVSSLVNPEFSPGLTDRVLCQSEHAGLPARLVLNKADLVADPRFAREIVADYARAGYPAHLVSAKTGEGLDELRHACRSRRSLFVGHSGVGKSTLLNAMVPGLELLAGKVNDKTGKGRHTTTAALLLRPESDLELVDTPGVRAFGLWGIGLSDLDQAYREFRPFLGSCDFRDCVHDTEPGCAVRAAVASHEIAALRYESYRKLRRELEEEEAPVARRRATSRR